MSKHENANPKNYLVLKVIGVIVFLMLIVLVLNLAYNYLKDDITDKTNLIINNSNITTSLKKEVYIEDGVVYISKEDIANFFDSSIYYDEKYDQIITASYNKLAALPVGKKQIEIDSSNITIKSGVIKKEDTYYVPFSELGDVYNTKTNYFSSTNMITIDSLNKEYSIATAAKKASIKYKPNGFSRTVAKVNQGDTYIIANRSDYPVPDGWTRVRTENGILGYVKTNQMGEVNTIREAIEEKAKVDGTVSMVWDYYSEYVYAPNRNGTTIQGVNVVSPSFFRLEKLGKGKVLSNIGEQGKAYIAWAKQNGYKIWPMIANESMIETTSEIMRDYKLRESLINQIVDYVTQYELDGINIDFEYMYEEDKNYFSRFLIELEPRLNEIGAVLSVDVTAPDGDSNWSMCYDRHTIGKVADYIVFMGYDQYGLSSSKEGTTAGCDWVEANLKKFVGQEAVEANKIILGVPFYTRLWKEQNGKVVSKDTLSMKNIDSKIPNNVEKKWDENLKQYYVEYKQGNTTYKIWVEDQKSIEAKLDLIYKYELAGASYWTKDMESPSIWKSISEKLGVK